MNFRLDAHRLLRNQLTGVCLLSRVVSMHYRLELSETTYICGWAVTHIWNSLGCFQKGRIWSDPYQQDLTENSYVLGW